jgi:Fe-S cluster assembly protein SufD
MTGYSQKKTGAAMPDAPDAARTANIASGFIHDAASRPCPSGWDQLRKKALESAKSMPPPSQEHEDWKYLDLRPVYSHGLSNPATQGVQAESQSCLATETSNSRLHFINGQLNASLSNVSPLPDGACFSGFANMQPAMADYLGKQINPAASDLFANLNTSFFSDGALLYVPKQLETPLHVVFQADGSGYGKMPFFFPRLLIVIESGARAHLVEEYFGYGKYLTSSAVEIFLGEGAVLQHDRVQREGHGAFHFCALHADIANSAVYRSTLISLGSAISRNTPSIAFSGELAELELNGLSMIIGAQAADTHSLIDHATPNCTSRQLQKYVIGDSAHGIFNGQIIVRPGAQHTNASQSSRNLLLSGKARIDAKPQLEIFADDVKCSHGATVGQLDTDELFYLQSRGLDVDSARNLLLAGFAADVINRLALPSLRRSLLQARLA